ncbi:nose resistant to fluoxetine protein 6-like [Drosophila hydei]|uniref:Nose resistant to fluoxetine protein 6-like n=1 Tax=Drosophila hydei TaxID=7224 RepID=A0A6J2SWT9_DROHY|nr:nose resistant to fluoxetine protein 6-like [Drosophila hydei]
MEIHSLSYEFSQHFRNITATDLNLSNSRLPNKQDLQCLADMSPITAGLDFGKLWSIKMFDAWCNLPKGILTDNFVDLGNYDECFAINKAISIPVFSTSVATVYATKDLCLNHTWYLAVDMQLYILSPIFLLSLYRWGKKAAAGIFVFMLLLSACLFSTMMTDKYFIHLEYGIISNNVQRKIYYATHTHAAPWLIGVLFGYFLHVNRNKNFQLNRIKICLGWIVSLALMFTCIFALYPYAKLTSPSLSILKQSSYYTFTRIAWPLSLCWVVFACMKGYGSLANSFLSAPIWQPLSKISYSAYIFHVFIVQINGRRARTNTYFSDYDMMLRFWGTFGFTLLLCYAIYCTTEAPIALLLGMLMPKRKTTPKSTVPEETKTESIPQLNKVAETETIPEIENLEEQSEANQKKRVEEL